MNVLKELTCPKGVLCIHKFDMIIKWSLPTCQSYGVFALEANLVTNMVV